MRDAWGTGNNSDDEDVGIKCYVVNQLYATNTGGPTLTLRSATARKRLKGNLTGEDRGQVSNVGSFSDQLVDGVLDAEIFVQFSRDGAQGAVGSFVSCAA